MLFLEDYFLNLRLRGKFLRMPNLFFCEDVIRATLLCGFKLRLLILRSCKELNMRLLLLLLVGKHSINRLIPGVMNEDISLLLNLLDL